MNALRFNSPVHTVQIVSSLTRGLAAFFLCLCCTLSSYALMPASKTVQVSWAMKTIGTGNMIVTLGGQPGDSDGMINPAGGVAMQGWRTFTMQAGITYNCSVQWSGINRYEVFMPAPDGYQLYVDGAGVGMAAADVPSSGGTNYFTIQLRPIEDGAFTGASEPGSFSGLDIGGQSMTWNISLGSRISGRPAGWVGIREKDFTNDPYSRDRLVYTNPGEIGQVITFGDAAPNANRIRQVAAPQVIVDAIDDSGGNGYTLNVYDASGWQVNWTLGRYEPNPAINPSPTPWKTIRVDKPTGTSYLRVTETEGNRIHQWQLELTSGTVASGAYVWTLREGGNAAGNASAITWVRTTTSTSTLPGGGGRDEVIETKDASNVVASKKKIHYADLGWGEQMMSVTDAYGSTDPLTTTYTYHSDSSQAGNYKHIQTITYPSGRWEAYNYYNDPTDWQRVGKMQYQVGPWVDTPAAAPSSTSITDGSAMNSGRAVAYDYTSDWLGRHVVLSSQLEYVNGQLTGKTLTTPTYPATMNDAQPRETKTTDHYSSSGSYVRTVSTVVRAGGDVDLVGRVRKVANPDGTMSSHVYERGTYNSATKTWSDTWGDYFREITLNGALDWVSGATWVTTWSWREIEPVYMIPNRSTMTAVIRDTAGNVLRTENYVYVGGTTPYALMTSSDSTYDFAGRLTQTIDNNGATVSNTYTNGRTTSTIAAAGAEAQFTYDLISRVATTVKKGASATAATLTSGYNYLAQTDITTTYTYDAVSRITQQVVSGGSLSQTTTRTFDLSGRQTQQVDPGSFTTGYAYSSGGKIVTTTLPSGSTQISETYLDGQTKQTSGTGVVSSLFTYSVDSSGKKCRQSTFGGVSAAWTNTYFDWLGRQAEEWIPGWNGSNTGKIWTYNSLGQLAKTTQPGLADTLYVYDALGVCYRQGLDIDANGTLDLASNDRITETSSSLFIDGSSRATSQTISKVYATANSGTTTMTSTSTTLLSGLGTGVISSSSSQDIHGNITTNTVTVDRANKKVTSTTDTPDSSVNAVSISYNGLSVEARDTAGIVVRSEYDALGRAVKSIDPRIGATVTAFVAGTNLVSTVTDPANIVVATYTYDSAGRVATMTDGLSKVARYSYTARGEKYREWGDTPNPVEYGYDAVGHQTTMNTYRGSSAWNGVTWPTTPGTADTTTWTFHAATGLLSSKTDADGKVTSYTYTQARQLATRTWARGVSATYAYSATTGEQTGIDYSDSTQDLSYTYDRLGKIVTVGDYTGTRTFHYSATNLLTLDETLGSTFYGNRVLTWKHDTTTTGALGRNTGFSLGLNTNLTGENDIGYTYDSYGRFTTLAANLAATASGNFIYGYTPNANLIGTLTETGSGLLQSRTYETNRNLTSQFATTLPSRNLATYAYTNDSLGRRTVKVETGEMFSRYGPGLVTKYGYNARSEVISSNTYLGTSANVDTTAAGNALQGRSYYYSYDPIGNRTATTINGQSSAYSTNSLNQIVSRTTPGYADVAGTAASNATVTVAGQSTTRQFDYFYRQHPLSNTSGPLWASLAVSATVPGGANTSENRLVYLAKALEQFTYDLDGNLLSDGRWDYTWDAENRLTSMSTTSIAVTAGIPQQSLQFRYDYLGRRVEKKVYNNGAGTPTTHVKFVYSSTNWHLLAEYDGLNSNAILRTYSWGLDLSRTTTGAGGVGGLLSIRDAATAATYLPSYDANGNVFALVNPASGAIVASYEYSAFGETLRATGSSTFADKNPFRFSTKYTDAETQLVYYGKRYYNPSVGRFVGRDTIEEKGGRNLYAFCGNNGVNRWDYLGMNGQEVVNGVSGYRFMGVFNEHWTQEQYDKNVDLSGRFTQGGLYSGNLGGGLFSTSGPEAWISVTNGIDPLRPPQMNPADYSDGLFDRKPVSTPPNPQPSNLPSPDSLTFDKTLTFKGGVYMNGPPDPESPAVTGNPKGAPDAAATDAPNNTAARPDADGHVSFGEAKEWWKNTAPNKGDLTVPIDDLNIHNVYTSDFGTRNQIVYSTWPSPTTGPVYGQVDLLLDRNTNRVTALPNEYNFEMHDRAWYDVPTLGRNILTGFGSFVNGDGTPYFINFTGSVTIPPERPGLGDLPPLGP